MLRLLSQNWKREVGNDGVLWRAVLLGIAASSLSGRLGGRCGGVRLE